MTHSVPLLETSSSSSSPSPSSSSSSSSSGKVRPLLLPFDPAAVLLNEVLLVFRFRPEDRDEEGGFDVTDAATAVPAALMLDDFFPSPRPLTTGATDAEDEDLSFPPFAECVVDDDDEVDECKPADDIVDAAADDPDDDFFPLPVPPLLV